MKTLTLRLTGPLQSYGGESNFGRRTSENFPTKSAILGMVAAALGYSRDDARILALNKLKFAVRIEQVGQIMTDFHLVEYKKDTRKLTYRDYLQDAVFMVALGSDDTEQIDNISYALRHPKFQLYLGRRSNPPAGPLVVNEFVDKNPVDVLSELDWQATDVYKKRYHSNFVNLEIMADAELLPGFPYRMIKDRIKSLKITDREHGFRPMATKRVKLYVETERAKTDHDIMQALESEGD